MVSFAPVAPLHLHRKLDKADVLGTYHLLIASEVLKDLEGHRDFWQSRKGDFIIIDNGVIELGYPLPVEDILLAYELVGASVLVLPDVIGDYEETVKVSKSAVTELRRHTNHHVNTLGVAQGKTVEEVLRCIDALTQLGVGMISIPRHLGDRFGTRELFVRKAVTWGIPIHLLGFSGNLEDDILCAAMPGVSGIDSALPVWLGLDPRREYLPLQPPRQGGSDFGRRPENYWTMDTDDMFVVDANVKKVRNWLNAAQAVHTRGMQSDLAGQSTPPSSV